MKWIVSLVLMMAGGGLMLGGVVGLIYSSLGAEASEGMRAVVALIGVLGGGLLHLSREQE